MAMASTRARNSTDLSPAALRQRLMAHPVYRRFGSPAAVRTFMEHHVFAVWDFMSLLKRLQRDVTCVDTPWMPPRNSHFARFINEIVLGEECDEDGRGGYQSHFELYLEAMREVGADVRPILRFLESVQEGFGVSEALTHAQAPAAAAQFVRQTMRMVTHGRTHEVCAAFFFGREDVIPDMFTSFVETLRTQGMVPQRLLYYLERHIEVDGDSHGPLAERLLKALCDDCTQRTQEAEAAARASLVARIALWDGVVALIA